MPVSRRLGVKSKERHPIPAPTEAERQIAQWFINHWAIVAGSMIRVADGKPKRGDVDDLKIWAMDYYRTMAPEIRLLMHLKGWL
jgi:hypothetical protein